MEKKQAYLITAYKDFAAVYELASFLCEYDKVYIHVDQKSKEIGSDEIGRLNALPNCEAYSEYAIAWGGYTHVQAILSLMKRAVADEEVSYMHLLTGEDFLLQSPRTLHQMFVEENRIYLSFIKEQDFNEAVKKRYLYYNLLQNKNVKNPILWQLQNFTVTIQKWCGIHRKALGEFQTIYKGLVYISLPTEAALDILDYVQNHPEYEKDLYRCQIPEEFFFHTLLLNESFCNGKWKEKIVDKELRYMNWERGNGGSPVYLNDDDYEQMADYDGCFARKFHGQESAGLKQKIKDNLW
ncbi:MAG: hypothetical protein IJZ44_07400 [Lachnospiraceae bacterium]|nr:hypothetical protein [Lachnospiraceae bacterium]